MSTKSGSLPGGVMVDPNMATIKEIAEASGISKSQAERNAAKDEWPFDEEILPTGNRRRLYPLAALPGAVYDALLIHRSGGALAPTVAVDPAYRPTATEIYQREVQGLSANGQRRMDAKLEILAAFDSFMRDGANIRVKEVRDRFAKAYNRRLVSLPDWVYETISHTCPNSLASWGQERKTGKLANLAGRYGARKGTGIFDLHPKLGPWITGYITKKPHAHVSEIYKKALADFGPVLEMIDAETGEITERPMPTKRGFERFIKEWKEDHPALYALATNPDLYRNKYEYAAEEMYKDVIRRNQLWEIDASPADVMCTDGRHSIYVCLDIHSRWPRARVTKTPKTAAALLLIRECMVGWAGRPESAWGVPDELRTDNGSDFVSNHFKDTIRRLGVAQDICDPYSPKQKAAVERMIGTIQQQFMELQPGYIGHNVNDRRLIEARRAFAQRLGQDDKDAFCVELTAVELQQRLNEWIEKVYVHQPHDGLDGKTPFDVRTAYRGRISHIEGEGALEMLLAAPADGDGTRTVTKKGIKVNRIDYYHGALMPGEVVHVRLDPDDLGKVYVYRGAPWEFVGIAINPEREGISRAAVAAEVKVRQKATLTEGMKEIRKAQREIDVSKVSLDLVAAAEKGTGGLAAFPPPSDAHSTPDIQAAVRAATSRKGKVPKAKPMTEKQQARQARLEAEMTAPAQVVTLNTKAAQFARAVELERRLEAGEVIPEGDMRWLNTFRSGAVYKSRMQIMKQYGLEDPLAV